MLLIQICCGFALAAVDPNLGLFTVPVSIICLYKRVRCHAMADLEAAFTSFWWTHVAIGSSSAGSPAGVVLLLHGRHMLEGAVRRIGSVPAA